MQAQSHITVTVRRLPLVTTPHEVLDATVTIQAASQTRVMLIVQEGEATDQSMSEGLFVSLVTTFMALTVMETV